MAHGSPEKERIKVSRLTAKTGYLTKFHMLTSVAKIHLTYPNQLGSLPNSQISPIAPPRHLKLAGHLLKFFQSPHVQKYKFYRMYSTKVPKIPLTHSNLPGLQPSSQISLIASLRHFKLTGHFPKNFQST